MFTEPGGKHITEAAKTWEGQLQERKKQQSAFKEVTDKAKADIEAARTAIQTLSGKAPQATLAAVPSIAPVSGETEETVIEIDKEEEEAMQQQLQVVLLNCAASIGMEQPLSGYQAIPMHEEDEDPDGGNVTGPAFALDSKKDSRKREFWR